MALDVRGAVGPVPTTSGAMPAGREPYNLDAQWARIALDLDAATLVQLDRLRLGERGFGWREFAGQLGNAGRMIIKGIVKASQ